MITAENLTFSYRGNPTPALNDLSFTIPKGELVCLCGTNGSGKSTLFSLLAGLQTPSAGELSVGAISAKGNEQQLRAQSALVLQDADLQIIGATVAEDMMLAFPANDAEAETTCRVMAERFSLLDHWDSPVHALSYGQKRKLCLAVSLLSTPSILLLDEPFSGLDYPAMLEMRSIMKANKELGLTQIVSVHDLEPVIDLADSMIVLHLGELKGTGSPEHLLGSLLEYGIRPPYSWLRKHTISPWG
ncbi:energy-coupling factor ABC transporter ATP-binding protein [Halodesulfovibrio sp. MK-HDV]|jgi:biotin transport system ATP-binding protein|uniref:energy-coupling factor ABC transporter ATP-binding protein n=1 Tax=Halodesulfovibrio sp. MK-HDV TaxID=2599925 RepID=UPI00136BCCD6|nr:ABC transporter ATP-binding protein [Halodesulfovibrio sp. MK-HDV]KAF1075029.1 Cobalt import ATP-binding protein CbiO [Halodesulfovibrio sp. MK-HDV]